LIYIRYFIHVALPLNNCIRSDFDIKDENIVFTYCFLYLRLQNKKNQAINCLVPSIHEDDKHINFFAMTFGWSVLPIHRIGHQKVSIYQPTRLKTLSLHSR